jgi:hypothetical protein
MQDEEIKGILVNEFGFDGQLLPHLIMESLESAGFDEKIAKNSEGEFETSFLGKKGTGRYPAYAMKRLWLEIYSDPSLRDKLRRKKKD